MKPTITVYFDNLSGARADMPQISCWIECISSPDSILQDLCLKFSVSETEKYALYFFDSIDCIAGDLLTFSSLETIHGTDTLLLTMSPFWAAGSLPNLIGILIDKELEIRIEYIRVNLTVYYIFIHLRIHNFRRNLPITEG